MTSDNSVVTEGVDVLVIGGGQAGLAMGYYLAERGLSFVIADANPEVGHMWRSRWQSLKLFTAGQYNDLPGMPFPAERDTYPGKDDVADFLRDYAAKFELPVRLNTAVTRLSKGDGRRYVAETTTGPIEADQVVVATGPFQVPFTPDIASDLDPGVTQLHSADYQGPDDLPEGRVLVVGAANSGQQIALELAQASRQVEISVGQKLPTLPQRWLGRDLWWWLTTLRVASVPVSSRLGQRLSQRDVVIGGGLRELRRHGVGVRPRVAGSQRTHDQLRGRRVSRLRRRRLGDRFPDRSLLDRHPRGQGRARRGSACPRRHRFARPLPARDDLAVHPDLGAARLGRRRRRLSR